MINEKDLISTLKENKGHDFNHIRRVKKLIKWFNKNCISKKISNPAGQQIVHNKIYCTCIFFNIYFSSASVMIAPNNVMQDAGSGYGCSVSIEF